MVKKPRVCAVIPVFHPAEADLEKLAVAIPDRDLIVIINDDNEYPVFAKAHRIDPKENLGFAGGVNRGIVAALSVGAEWIVVFNQDINLTAGVWRSLTMKLSGLPPGIYGPEGGSLDPQRFTSILNPENRQISYISGSCMAIHQKVVETVGYFYEPYFMYYEDVDYCLRAERADFPVSLLPVSGITHRKQPVMGKGSRHHEYYLSRNHWFLIRRLAPRWVHLAGVIRLPVTLAGYLTRGNLPGFIGLIHGVIGFSGKKDQV